MPSERLIVIKWFVLNSFHTDAKLASHEFTVSPKLLTAVPRLNDRRPYLDVAYGGYKGQFPRDCSALHDTPGDAADYFLSCKADEVECLVKKLDQKRDDLVASAAMLAEQVNALEPKDAK